jgi:hypothetical protein
MIEASVVGPLQSEPRPAGSHETALKNFLSVSELALDRKMAATYILGPFRLDAETDTLFRHGGMHVRRPTLTVPARGAPLNLPDGTGRRNGRKARTKE